MQEAGEAYFTGWRYEGTAHSNIMQYKIHLEL